MSARLAAGVDSLLNGDSLDVRLEAMAAERAAAGTAPALAVGVFAGGKLRATALRGSIDAAGRPPRADTAFRIASCTKSFTAAAVLILRDRGLLDLDSEVATHLPFLRLIGPAEDMPTGPLTLRMLLTMSGGLPTDDPWADRQEAMPDADFEALLAAGVRLVRKPGTDYEYSNLGYAMLGAVIAAVTGQGYTEFVRDELLEPLGLVSTGFDASVRAAGGVALGYCRRGGAWEPQPFSGPGAFSAIGGLFSTLHDLGRWADWLADGFTDAPEPAGEPLSRASRREMQQLHRYAGPESLVACAAGDAGGSGGSGGSGRVAGAGVGGYGFGLRVLADPERGLVIGHSGGYPGFSSHMTWYPASGAAVVGFENATYAKVGGLVREVLAGVLDGGPEPAGAGPAAGEPATPAAVEPARTAVAPWPETLAARAVVERLVEAWDEDLAGSVFAGNVELDEPIADRRRGLQQALAAVGPLRHDAAEPGFSETAARLEWVIPGTRGGLKCQLSMTPEAVPKVQTLTFSAVTSTPGDAAAPLRT
ncbi:penicillin-binding protein [Arthrobacter sp. NicSoilB4]|uniref:serine hydrolase domain-containing protein n=1 Tax=Arthrobacter sp. NicSoilB4 TaxID=2830997 RepID=UPI001CC74E42|nr:serine hydrolase domain-containing protein [Arthrobacter sp. NicSoilB4]BCW66119.1 penicillin-binding protein [Arthrobacter sp. NicSoilB4]